jgi:hypothetical protein
MTLRESIGFSGLARKGRSEARRSKRTNLQERSVRTDMVQSSRGKSTSVEAVRKPPRGGIGASNVDEQTVPRAFACVVSDAKDMGAVLDDCCKRQS